MAESPMSETLAMGLLSLVSKAGATWTEAVEEFGRLAGGVQRQRFDVGLSDSERVTRFTSLFVLMAMDAGIREALDANGLSATDLGNIVGLDEFEPRPSGDADVELHDHFARALDDYLADRSGDRPLDLVDLAVAVFASARSFTEGGFAERLERTGLDVDEALRSLEALLPSSGDGGAQFSRSVRKVMDELGPDTPVTATQIAAALQKDHPRYGGDRFGAVTLDPTVGSPRTTADWMASVRGEYDLASVAASRHEVIDGELTLLALSRLDPNLGLQLLDGRFLDVLTSEVEVKPASFPKFRVAVVAADLQPGPRRLVARVIDGLPVAIATRGRSEVVRVDLRTGAVSPLPRQGQGDIDEISVADGRSKILVVLAAGSLEFLDIASGEHLGGPTQVEAEMAEISAATVGTSTSVAYNLPSGCGVADWDDLAAVPVRNRQFTEGRSSPVVYAFDGRIRTVLIERGKSEADRIVAEPDQTEQQTWPAPADSPLEQLFVGGSSELGESVVVSRSGPGLIERWGGGDGAALPGRILVDGSDTRHLAVSRRVIAAAGDEGPLRLYGLLTGLPVGDPIDIDLGDSRIVEIAVAGREEHGVVAIVDSAGRLHAVLWGDFDAQGADSGPEPKVTRDYWTAQDSLGYSTYARAIALFIRQDDTQPPLTIGVKGPWGAGKTSILRMVQAELDPPRNLGDAEWEFPAVTLTETGIQALDAGDGGRDGISVGGVYEKAKSVPPSDPDLSTGQTVVPAVRSPDEWRPTVWFNPWMYQTGEEVWAGLAQQLISQVTDRLPPREREAFWLRLNMRRVDRNALRRRLYRIAIDRVMPALVTAAVTLLLFLVNPVQDMTGDPSGRWWWAIPGVGLSAAFGWAAVALTRLRRTRAAEIMPDLVRGPIAAAGEGLAEEAGSFSDLVSDPDYSGRAGFLYLMHNDINHVLDLIATPKQPLVVFVDDLDRCSPGVVAQTIEAINLFLAGEFPNCIFVLAVEPSVVAAHVESQNKDLVEYLRERDLGGDWLGLGWRFLEKIVQLPLTLPRPDEVGAGKYLDSLLAAPGPAQQADEPASPAATAPQPPAEEMRSSANLQELSDRRRDYVRTLVEEGTDAAEAEVVATDAAIEVAAELYSDSDPAIQEIIKRHALALPSRNPREMKRFINLFRFYNFVTASTWVPLSLPSERELVFEKVARLATLVIRWPFFLNFLAAYADEPSGEPHHTALEILEEAARSDTWSHALLRLDLASPAKSNGEEPHDVAGDAAGDPDDGKSAEAVPLEPWADQIEELHRFLAEPASPRIGHFAKGLL